MARMKPDRCPALLKNLVEAYGISGSESSIRLLIEKEVRKYVDVVQTDKMGNLVATRKGSKPRVMLTAHMDEVGLVTKNIDESGRIYFYTVGYIDTVSMIGQRVYFVDTDKAYGVITTAELSDGENVEKLPKQENLYVDTGFTKQELEKHGIGVGAFMGLVQEFGLLANAGMIYGKALDDRVGCYIITEVARRTAKMRMKEEVNFVYTVQEEIGLYGAKTSAYKISPDWALVVDVTSSSEKSSVRLVGKGPCVTVMDSATIGNKCINHHISELARKSGIPLQMDVSDVGTTDALSISISKEGVPSTALGVPVKNLHTTVGIASLDDIENCIRLIIEVLKKPPKECLK